MPVSEPSSDYYWRTVRVAITDERFVQAVLDHLNEPTDGPVDEFDQMRAALRYAVQERLNAS